MNYFPPTRGYVAIVSAIILSAILTGLVFAESASTFWSRYDQLDQLSKLQDSALAGSCAYETLLEYAENSGATALSAGQNCVIDSVIPKGQNGNLTFYMHSNTGAARNILEVTINKSLSTGILSITSWRDITSIPP